VDNEELITIVKMDASQTELRELATMFDVTILTILNHLKRSGKVKKLDRSLIGFA